MEVSMNHQSCEQLTQMNLSAMRGEYQRQEELPATLELGFDERFSMIVQAQFDRRRDNRIKRALKEAALREPSAALSEIEFSEKRNLSKRQIAQLSGMSWAREGKGIIVTGATGTGKTFILCAFAHEYSVDNGCFPKKIEQLPQLLVRNNDQKHSITDVRISSFFRSDSSYFLNSDDHIWNCLNSSSTWKFTLGSSFRFSRMNGHIFSIRYL